MAPPPSPSPSIEPGYHLLEITLISAQDLKPSASTSLCGGLRAFAVVSIPSLSTPRLRTRIDRVGSSNPTWNDRFLFRLPLPLLSPDSPSSLSVELFTHGGTFLPDSPLGSARIPLSTLNLLRRPPDVPSFSAVAVRRRSGRFRGVLNLAFALLSRVPLRAAEALVGSTAVGYRDLVMGSMATATATALREVNRVPTPMPSPGRVIKNVDEEKQLCGFGGIRRRIHLSPSDENFHLSSEPEPENKNSS